MEAYPEVEIEAASLRVRQWLRGEITRKIEPVVKVTPKSALRIKLADEPKRERVLKPFGRSVRGPRNKEIASRAIRRDTAARGPRPKRQSPREKLSGRFVIERMNAGLSIGEIAKEVDMGDAYVSKILHGTLREGIADLNEMYARMTTCACSRKKMHTSKMCAYCGKLETKKAATKARQAERLAA